MLRMISMNTIDLVLVRMKKQNEVLRLVQTSTMAKYYKKFVELSKYVVAYGVDNCKRFEQGLKKEIRSVVTTTGYENFGKL